MAQLTRAQLRFNIARDLPDNQAGEISPADVRVVCDDLADSMFLRVVGAPGRDAIRYVNGSWSPVSLVTTSFAVLTRGGDFGSLKAAIEAWSAAGGTHVALPALGAICTSNWLNLFAIRSQGSSAGDLDDVWPLGGSAPWVWVVSPLYWGLAGRNHARFDGLE